MAGWLLARIMILGTKSLYVQICFSATHAKQFLPSLGVRINGREVNRDYVTAPTP